jgi:hypothetical protein
LESDYYPVKKDESGEYTVGGLMMVKAPRIGLAVHTTDYSDDASNTLGIYNAGLFKNDSMAFEFSMSGYDAPDTKYINAHQDYKEAQSGRRIHRLFRMPGNNLAIYNPKANSGVLKLQAGVETPLSVVVKDYFDNQSVIKLNLAYDSTTLDPPKRIYNYLFPYNEDNAIKDEDFTFFLPKGCLYRKGMIQYSKSPERSSHVHSKLYNLYNATGDPMHGSADVFLPAVNLPDSMKTKAYAVVCNSSGGGATVLDAVWDGDILHAKATRWGSYCIMTDITPPSINFAHKGKKKHLPELTDHITFNFHDNLSGVALWDVWINDQWVLLDYDQKSGTYTYWFDEHVSLVDGDNKVIVQATDKAGNSNVEEYHFNYRK